CAEGMGSVSGKAVLCCLFSSMWRPPSSVLQLGVQGIPQSVSQQVQGEDGQHDGKARERAHPPGRPEILPAGADHRTPLRRGRADAQADEAEAGNGQDGPGDGQRGLHNDGGHAVGQDVLEDDALVAGADGAGRLDVLLVLDGQNGGADDPGKGRDVGDADGQHHIRDAGAHGGHQGDGQQDAGDRQ
ncbi:Integrase, partial [Dysosmobacter welbionis]